MKHIGGQKSWRRKLLMGVSYIAVWSAAALAADTITGVVRNQTRSRLAIGDEVILLRLDRGMQEETRTKTDSRGSFLLKVQHPGALHLVRVVHQGVNYDQRASVGDAVSIDVFDAAAKVQGITGSIEIIRIGTNGNLLHICDMVEIRNDSVPPRTKVGERTFEVYLPAHAKMDSVHAAGSGKIGVTISAAPVPGEPGHYTVNFPLRPGATQFAFNYDLPYDGRTVLRTKSRYPLQQLAVMMPPTMKFIARSPAFQVLPTGNNSYQVEAATQVKAGEGSEFEISGMGTLPALQAQIQSPAKPSVAALPVPALSALDNSRARSQGANALSAAPSSGLFARPWWLEWWVLSASAILLFAVGGFLLWRRQHRFASVMTMSAQNTEWPRQISAPWVGALKDELFQLEVDRLQGTISGEEYVLARQALEGTVERAVARARTGVQVTQN